MALGRRMLRRHIRRIRGVERFVRRIVGGGLGLVAGLWIVRRTAVGSLPWGLGGALALAGLGGLAVGIWSQIEY